MEERQGARVAVLLALDGDEGAGVQGEELGAAIDRGRRLAGEQGHLVQERHIAHRLQRFVGREHHAQADPAGGGIQIGLPALHGGIHAQPAQVRDQRVQILRGRAGGEQVRPARGDGLLHGAGAGGLQQLDPAIAQPVAAAPRPQAGYAVLAGGLGAQELDPAGPGGRPVRHGQLHAIHTGQHETILRRHPTARKPQPEW